MLLGLLIFAAVLLTCFMFLAKEPLLGFPCAIFWAIAGAQAYMLSTVPWGDVYFYIFFACAFGMTIFTMFAAFAVRKRDLHPKKQDWEDSGAYVDEGLSAGAGGDAEPASHKTQEVRNRAERRRSRGIHKPINWKDFK